MSERRAQNVSTCVVHRYRRDVNVYVLLNLPVMMWYMGEGVCERYFASEVLS